MKGILPRAKKRKSGTHASFFSVRRLRLPILPFLFAAPCYPFLTARVSDIFSASLVSVSAPASFVWLCGDGNRGADLSRGGDSSGSFIRSIGFSRLSSVNEGEAELTPLPVPLSAWPFSIRYE